MSFGVVIRLPFIFITGVFMAEEATSPSRADQGDWVKAEVQSYTSLYTSAASVAMLHGRLCLASVGNETRVVMDPCATDEMICHSPRLADAPMYTLMYETFFTRLCLHLPLSNFECDVFNYLHLAPTQLHPNGCAFECSFTIVSYVGSRCVSRSLHVLFPSKDR